VLPPGVGVASSNQSWFIPNLIVSYLKRPKLDGTIDGVIAYKLYEPALDRKRCPLIE